MRVESTASMLNWRSHLSTAICCEFFSLWCYFFVCFCCFVFLLFGLFLRFVGFEDWRTPSSHFC